MSDKDTRYYAQTMPGVEEIAWLEIRARLENVGFGEFVFAKEQNGIVTFDYGGAVADLLQLRTTEDVFLQALSIEKVSRDWRDLRTIANRIKAAPQVGRVVGKLLKYRRLRRPPTYRVISRKYGKHQYRRKDLEQAVLKGFKERYPRWKPVSDQGQVEIWANLLGSRLLLGLRLTDRTMRHRFKKTTELKASLRPSVAASMVFLTQPEANDVFLDPMCGSGTLLQERQLVDAYAQIIGGDIQAERARAALGNLAARRKDFHKKAIAICQWDGTHLPFSSMSIDKVASNLPFGKQIGSQVSLKQLYPSFFAELNRLLRPRGRAVVLSGEYDLVKEAVRKQPGLEILSGYSVAVLGQWGRIYILERRR